VQSAGSLLSRLALSVEWLVHSVECPPSFLSDPVQSADFLLSRLALPVLSLPQPLAQLLRPVHMLLLVRKPWRQHSSTRRR